MAWFRRKGKYWYFVERVAGKEVQHYVGSDEAIKKRLLPNAKIEFWLEKKKEKEASRG